MQHYSFDELHDAILAHELLLVKPFMPIGGHCMLHGKRGLGKTQLAHTLAIDVALGLPFLGEYATVQGNVAYVQADMTNKLQQARAQRLRAGTGLAPGIPLHYFTCEGSFDALEELGAEEHWIEELQALQPLLVVVDTLRKSHRMDENVSNTPVEVYAAWRSICGPQASILYLHHDRKSFDAPHDKDEEFRGTGAWLDEADLGMHLCKTRGGLHLEWSKLRTCADTEVPPAINLRMDPDSLLLIADDPVESYIKDACRMGLPKPQIVSAAQDKARWGMRAMSQATAYRRLQHYHQEMVKNGDSHSVET